jgi:transposase
MPSARYIKLSEAEDKRLKEIEESPGLAKKVRLRAKVLRLSHRGMKVTQIAVHVGRDDGSILRDFNRWEESKIEGLSDGKAVGQRSPLGEVEKAFIREKLAEERSWTASTLAEAVNKKFKLKVNRESMRVCLLDMSYTWQRQRYVPVKTPDAKQLSEAKEALEGFKKKPKQVKSS